MTRFESLTWLRLTATFLNTRKVADKASPPVSVFQAIVKGVTTAIGPVDDTIIFNFQRQRHYREYREGERIVVEFFFCRHTRDYVTQWRETLSRYLDDPENARNFRLLDCSAPEARSYEMLASHFGKLPTQGELCLEFITPLPFKPDKGKPLTFLDARQLVTMFESRFSRLFGRTLKFHGDSDSFRLLPYYWHFDNSWRHGSKSQPGTEQIIGGCLGNLYIKGDFGDLLPFLILGSELHAGTKLPNAQGAFRIHSPSPGFFDRRFPTATGLRKAINSVLIRYDSALESLSAKEMFPFNEHKFALELCERIKAGTYEPSPNISFAIAKKNGSERIVEHLGFRDLIVQQYLLEELSKPFDRMFEESSIGFRKGASRHNAIAKVQAAIADGFQYVVESDIDDFFPSVDLGILERLIDASLPEADIMARKLIGKLIRAGSVLNGTYRERLRGLAQGAPLSPILANLYLDSFDEHIGEQNARMIRFADDFIILTRSREDATRMLASSQECLAAIGLCINLEKTAIHPIKEGFRFLGMTFKRTEVEVSPEEDFKRYRKPLFITEPFLFLSLNGDAIEIKRTGEILDTIPMRRLSEIIVMEKAVFSTGLIKKCTDLNIPLTITLNTGYYVTTIKPDSKQFYTISCEHMRKHEALTDTERIGFAQEFAAVKLRNYIALFKQRYSPETGRFIHELERIIQHIYQSGSIETVRGHEGSAAKKIYRHMNELIDDSRFHFKKRERENPDPINSLFNFGYYLLFARINASIRALGLNPYLGFLHKPEDSYESLVCDVEELFRSRIDRFIVRLLNLKIITINDFEKRENGHRLYGEGIKKYLAHFETEMERKNEKNPLSLKESIYAQASRIRKYYLEDAPLTFYEWQI